MIEILVAVTVALTTMAALSLISWGIEKLLDIWRDRHKPQLPSVSMSETDTEKIQNTKEIIKECFGGDTVEKLRKASNKERIALMAEFADRLVKEYGLDIDVDVTVNNAQNCGYYDWGQKKAVFNIVLLMVDGNNEHFDFCVREMLDTIVHELRHAVQHKAIGEPGFWNVDEERRMTWANNMAPGNYISAADNMKRYSQQPIEADAVAFAVQAIEGVC